MPDRRAAESAPAQLVAPGDQMRARHGAKFFRAENAGEAHEVLHRVFVGSTGVPVADVGEPFDLGRHVGEFLEFGGGQQSVRGCDLDRKRIGRRGDVHVAPDKNRTGGYQGWAGQESAEQEV